MDAKINEQIALFNKVFTETKKISGIQYDIQNRTLISIAIYKNLNKEASKTLTEPNVSGLNVSEEPVLNWRVPEEYLTIQRPIEPEQQIKRWNIKLSKSPATSVKNSSSSAENDFYGDRLDQECMNCGGFSCDRMNGCVNDDIDDFCD